MQIVFNVKLPATVKKKKAWFVSSCPILDVHSQGETKEKALKNLVEALRLFFISCYERGTLDEVLRSCGFKPIAKGAIRPERFSKKYESVNVPLPFQTTHGTRAGSHQCHA